MINKSSRTFNSGGLGVVLKVHLRSKPIFLSMGLFISHELGTGKIMGEEYGGELG